jgi:hypothetical protein
MSAPIGKQQLARLAVVLSGLPDQQFKALVARAKRLRRTRYTADRNLALKIAADKFCEDLGDLAAGREIAAAAHGLRSALNVEGARRRKEIRAELEERGIDLNSIPRAFGVRKIITAGRLTPKSPAKV